MARSLRIDVPNGWYHVLNRGIGRRQIFPRAEANSHFLELLGCLPSRFGVRVHAYVLMGNHYHLQLETPRANLSRAMQWLNLSYGAWFNRRRSSYQVYAGKARNPGWLTTDSIYRFFADDTLSGLQRAYRRQLEEMAALGQWETDWRDAIKATIFLGDDKFIKNCFES